MVSKLRIGIALCSLLSLSLFWATLTKAQVQDSQWSAPHRLSSIEGVFKDSSNTMVADQYGYVHVFWVEEGFADERAVIQYARFDGDTWSTTLDVHVTQPGDSIGFLSSAVDRRGILHLTWSGGFRRGPVHYMYAPAFDALSAQHWSDPVRIDVPAHLLGLQVDAGNVLHILYSNFGEPQPGIYYIRSEDQGRTWSYPIWLDPDIPPNQVPSSLQFATDETDDLHAVWHYFDLENEIGKSAYYAHSLDGGISWSLPIAIDEPDEGSDELRMANPGLAVQGQDVHVIWAGDSQTHREHRFSTDSGQSWSVPVRVFGNLHGQAISDGLAMDAAGRVHFVGQIRYPQGLYHAYWDQGYWMGLSLFYLISIQPDDPIGDRIHAHSIRLVVRNGNQLVTTFYDRSDERPFALYAMHRTLQDISPAPAVSIPSRTPIPTPTTQPSATATPLAPTSTPRTTRIEGSVPSSSHNISGPYQNLWLALIPALLTAAGTIAFQLVKKR